MNHSQLNKAIIFGASHYNTLGLLRSLGTSNIPVVIFYIGCTKSFIRKSKFTTEIYNGTNLLDVGNQLIDYIKTMQCKPVLFAAGDEQATFIDNHYELLSQFCYLEGAKMDGGTNFFRNKNNANILAKKSSFNVPKTLTLYDSIIPIPIVYPLITKANESIRGGKSLMKVVFNDEELSDFLSGINSEFFPLQLQEFIRKEFELMILGCSLDEGRIIHTPVYHIKHRHYPDCNGAGAYSKSYDFTKSSNLIKSLYRSVSNYLSEIGYTGLFSAEFIYSKGKYYFLEINLRNDATSFLSTKSGYNLPLILYRYFIYNENSIKENNFKSCNYMNGLLDIRNVLKLKVNPFKWIVQLFKTNCFSCFDIKDPIPFFYYLYEKIPINKK